MRPSDEILNVRESASSLYGAGQEIWDANDAWNEHKRRNIEAFILQTTSASQIPNRILDAGCGMTAYDWMLNDRVNLDRFFSQLQDKPNAVVAELEQLPFEDCSFNLIFCIGSVLNYVSAIEAITELSRVSAKGCRLYLHFETSSSFEQFGRNGWNASVKFIKTINAGRPDAIWVYSPAFILRSLAIANFRILRQRRFHIFSALMSRFGFAQPTAAMATKFDALGRFMFNFFADDIIVLAEKI